MATCNDCHDVHATHGNGPIKGSDINHDTTCLKCHKDYNTVKNSKHDFTDTKANDVKLQNITLCSKCHMTHEKLTLAQQKYSICLNCHNNKNAKLPKHYTHSAHVQLTHSTQDFLFYIKKKNKISKLKVGDVGDITCFTCHNSHLKNDLANRNNFFNRDKKDLMKLCASCHGSDAITRLIWFHSNKYREAGF